MQTLRNETRNGIRERVGTIVRTGVRIPVALWSPENQLSDRLILVGHGASGTKHESYVVALARGMVRAHGCTVVAIDGPVHGDRRVDPTNAERLPFLEFVQRWSSDAELTDSMVADWQFTIDAMFEETFVAPDSRVGYWGLSMGTILGLPLVAAERRIEAAVLGLMGATGPTRDRLVHDARAITVPTMFLMQWDDELFARSDVLELFGLLGSSDKTLIASPGAHGDVTAENFQRSSTFLVDRLSNDVSNEN